MRRTSGQLPRVENVAAATRDVLRVGARARLIRRVDVTCAVASTVLVASAAAALLDAALRFPAPVRVAMLAGLAMLITASFRRRILPAWRFRPSPVDVALRIERSRPELRGLLASSVEFDLSGTAATSELAARAVAEAEVRSRGADFLSILRPRPAFVQSVLLVALLGAGTIVAMRDPESVGVALRRMLTPWSDAAWPARTAIEGLVRDGTVAARGRPIALRAQLVRGDPTRERVRAEYRFVRGEETDPWTEVVLAQQPSGEFERLVETAGDRVEVRFRTSDARTEPVAVRLVDPPSVLEASLHVDPPGYASRIRPPRAEELGDGTDGRATLREPVLRGSMVALALALSRPVPVEVEPPQIVLERADGSVEPAEIEVDPEDPARWNVRTIATGPTRIAVDLVDADGIRQDEPVVLSFDVIDDRAPSAAIAQPVADESVVADARVPVEAEARDDLELRGAGVEIETFLGRDGADATRSLVLDEKSAVGPGDVAARTDFVLRLADLGLAAGDSVVLRAYADDWAPGEGDGQRERIRSAPRTIRIVGEEEFERQIRSALAGVRRDAMRMDERQATAREAVERQSPADGTPEREAVESQGAVSDGLARMRAAIESARARLGRNGREEGVLGDLAEQAEELAESAEAQSARASSALERTRSEGDPSRREQSRREATDAQEEVRADLEDLVSLLDRDEDAWTARRRLEALGERIRRLVRETDQAARRSGGESREQLSPEARAEVDALAERQQQAAEEAEQVVSELRERSEQLAEADRNQSRALGEAARLAEEGRVRAEMERAAEESRGNRLEQSRAAQERAAEALARAAAALDEERKVRAEELARELEDLVESVRRLLEAAIALRVEVAASADEDADARDGLARSAGRLSQNVRGTAADARTRSREAARAARALDAAATSLGGAAGALRAEPWGTSAFDDAGSSMDAAVRSLEEALAEAEKAQERAEERAEQERREELAAKYRAMLERQVSVRAAVERIVPDGDRPLGRRELIESRRLGTVQEELRGAIGSIRESDEDVRASDALVELHGVIDVALVAVREQLAAGAPAVARAGQDEAVEALSAIVGALEDDPAATDDDEFGESGGGQEGAGGGGGQPQGAIPPVAEIRMLRAMQDSLAKRTRAFSEVEASLEAVDRANRIADLATRQARIVELAERIAEKIGGGAAAPTIEGPQGIPSPESGNAPNRGIR